VTQIAVEWHVNGSKQRKTIDPDKSVSIGRHPACDIVLGDPHVSRRHASIYFNNDGYHIHNLSQTNPIIFNDRWTLGHDLKADLKVGDTFVIGRIRITVKLPHTTGDISQPPEPKQQVECPECGQIYDSARESCIWCGTSLADIETVELEEEQVGDYS
jgi:predicted component of type VI protein secretion system